MTNAERAQEWLVKHIIGRLWNEEVTIESLTDLLNAVRLDEAEWWWNDADGRKYLEQHERITQLQRNATGSRANSSGNQAK